MFKDAIKKLVEDNKIVKFNRAIAEGVGYTQAKDGVHERVNTILQRELTYDPVLNPRLPKGLAYTGYRFMSPFETYMLKLYRSDSRTGRGRTPINVAKTDTYTISARFRVPNDGHPVTRPLQLPFIRRGSLMNYYGTTYHVATVIHQPGICREHGGLFVNFDFTRKVSFKTCKHPVKIMVNGGKEELYIPGTSKLYSPNNPSGNDTDEKPLAYWIFGKYGFSEAIKRYTGKEVKIISTTQIPDVDLEKWVVIQSGDPKFVQHIRYALIVEKSALPSLDKMRWDQDEHILLVLCGAFYKAAHFYTGKEIGRGRTMSQQRLTPLFTTIDEFDPEGDIINLNSAQIWKEILGRSIQGTKTTDLDLHSRMHAHFAECNRYVNETFRGELRLEDPDIDDAMDMFDFLFYTTNLMVRTRLTRQEDLASMYGKRLTVVDYLLLGKRGFTSTVSEIRWALHDLDEKMPQGPGDTPRRTLNTRLIATLPIRGITSNGEVSFFNASTESMVLAVSTHAVSQTETDAKSNKGGKTINLNDRTKQASASHLTNGNVYYIPKSSPWKYGILNQYMSTTRSLVMIRNPKLEEVIREVEDDISQIGR